MADENKEQSTDDVLQMLDSLEADAGKKKGAPGKKAEKGKKKEDEEDIMAFLDSVTKSQTNSGRNSPAVKSTEKFETAPAPAAATTNTTTTTTAVASEPPVKEEKKQAVPERQSTATPDAPDPIGVLSSWWSKNKGDIWQQASGVVKQAEQRVREFQPEGMQASQQAIESLGGSISKFGLSGSSAGGFLKTTWSTVLDTIAPPISLHEQLKIHIFHDMVGYPAIDTIVYNVFERVMQQVEGGGELTMIVQKGKERHRRGSDKDQRRDLNIFRGELAQGKKLAAANIEDYVHSIEKNKGKDYSAEEQSESSSTAAVEDDQETKVRVSDIYLSIQPAATASEEKTEETSDHIAHGQPNTFAFVVYLSDPAHEINFSTVSQPFPYQWAQWLDHPDGEQIAKQHDADPRDWVVDWIEEGLGLAVGVVAQSYVAKRMGAESLFGQ